MKKILCCILSIILVLPLIVSCTDTNDNAPTTTAPTDPNDATPEELYGEYDLQKQEFVLLIEQRETAYNEFFADPDEGEGDVINDAIYQRYMRVQDLLNCTVEVMDSEDRYSIGTTLRDAITAGTSDYDAALLGYSLPTVFSDQYLCDLKTVPTLNLDRNWWDQNAINDFTINNHLYVATGDISYVNLQGSMIIYYNKKIASDYKLPNLYDLVRNNQWTMDKLIEFATQCTSELTGDDDLSTDDQVGFVGEATAMAYFFNASGQRTIVNDGSSLTISPLTNRYISAVEAYSSLVANSAIALHDVNYPNSPITAFSEGRIAFLCDAVYKSPVLRNMDTDFGILPLPMLDDQQDTYYTPVNYYWASYAVIPANNPRINDTGVLLDAFAYYGHKLTRPAVYEASFDSKIARDEESREMMDLILDSTTYDIGWLFDFGGIRNCFTDFGNQRKPSVSRAIKGVQNKIKDDIELMLEQLFKA